jgi:hypothetical protein
MNANSKFILSLLTAAGLAAVPGAYAHDGPHGNAQGPAPNLTETHRGEALAWACSGLNCDAFQRDQCTAIPQPAQFAETGYYATKYCTKYDGDAKVYRISMQDFIYRK